MLTKFENLILSASIFSGILLFIIILLYPSNLALNSGRTLLSDSYLNLYYTLYFLLIVGFIIVAKKTKNNTITIAVILIIISTILYNYGWGKIDISDYVSGKENLSNIYFTGILSMISTIIFGATIFRLNDKKLPPNYIKIAGILIIINQFIGFLNIIVIIIESYLLYKAREVYGKKQQNL